MSNKTQPNESDRKHARAVKTAWVLGIIAMSIFATFIGSAIIGH